MIIKKTILLAIITLTFSACFNKSGKLNVNVSDIEKPNVEIRQYGKAMFAIPQDQFMDSVMNYAEEFPLLFGEGQSDSAALLQLNSFFSDPYMKELNNEARNVFADISDIEEEFSSAMQHYKYYFPKARDYNFYSYISGLDLQFPIKVIDNNFLIGLDLYLGNTKVYDLSGFPKYKSVWLKRESLVPDAMSELAMGIMPEPQPAANLIHQFIEQGKRLYFIQAMIPEISDSLLLKYEEGQLEWCMKNEARLWSLMIENQFLFKNDVAVQKKFMDDGPFTSILSAAAPARLGHFIGWRIISYYMENNDVSLADLLLETDDQKILKKSKYKPSR